ncbi:periplasmic heavy metal sensor [Desulfobulbus sp.]|uniref:periplasmic heavy metal sensor n=1 Tax=Desulfobulbus sp. TaxID=895 RepID=UPI00286F33C5|nr:periplasmic heavy metal sensor [Desulfobulbus sp.]
MAMTTSKKKLMLAAILTSGLTLAISQAGLAESPKHVSTDKQSEAVPQAQMSLDMRKAHDKFLDDTIAIRKELAEKRAVMRALMKAGTPDTVKASQVAGELFELREKLRAKAREAGLSLPMGMGRGMGMGDDDFGCQGMMGHGIMEKHYRSHNY